MKFSKKMIVTVLHSLMLFLIFPLASSADILTLPGTLSSPIYDAGDNNDYVTPSSCTVNPNVSVIVKAYDYIILKPGFSVSSSAGSTFHAYTTNPDSDGDGIPNTADLNPGQNDAFLDTDGDGLSNLEEYIAGTNQNKADMDEDGYNDLVESLAGSNHNDGDDKPSKGNYYKYDELGRITAIVRVN